MSKREELTRKIDEFISENGLNKIYSGTGLSKDKKYRYVLFNVTRYFDGEIRVYNEKYISVKYQTAFRDLPNKGWGVVSGYDALIDWIKEYVIRR
jgi:hypothetical protein